MSPQVHGVLLLMGLIDVVVKIGKSRGNAFKVKHSRTGPVTQITALGHQLFDCLPALGLGLSAAAEMCFDPRIDVAVIAAQDQGQSEYSVQTLREWLHREPWSAANTLNGMVDQIRYAVNSRAFMHHVQRRKEKHATQLQDLMAYFKCVAELHPAASVMRLELRGHPHASVQWKFLQSSVASLHESFHDWLRQAQSAYGEIIVAHAWKIDLDGLEGFFVHLVLVIEGPQPVELLAMERALGESWRSMAGGASYMLSCKGDAMELEYRGGRPGAWNYSLDEELHDASTFLVGTDSLLAWAFDGKPPTHGRGRMPEKNALQRSGRVRAPSVRETRP